MQSYTHIAGSLCTLKDNHNQLQPTTATTIAFVDTAAGNSLHRERSRHIAVRKYYVRELVEDKLVKLMPCGTKRDGSRCTNEKPALSPFQNSQKHNARCHIATGKRLMRA